MYRYVIREEVINVNTFSGFRKAAWNTDIDTSYQLVLREPYCIKNRSLSYLAWHLSVTTAVQLEAFPYLGF
jgi:hypothetical protein